ncbi:hypothetical protein DFH07DRAFT_971483 [Mycena maculata]|uniref:Secreted protein n=1 Tax=Mycena maculata TaxID=230809 RepID=A0AAD7HLZ3_9AGAR|nr:hypothetical protein DFH07DRAFT_971483 [Mycena maculata]
MSSKPPLLATSILLSLAAATPTTQPTSAQWCEIVRPSSSTAVSVSRAALDVPTVSLNCARITVAAKTGSVGASVVCGTPDTEWRAHHNQITA